MPLLLATDYAKQQRSIQQVLSLPSAPRCHGLHCMNPAKWLCLQGGSRICGAGAHQGQGGAAGQGIMNSGVAGLSRPPPLVCVLLDLA